MVERACWEVNTRKSCDGTCPVSRELAHVSLYLTAFDVCLTESDAMHRTPGGSPAFQEEVLVAVGFLLVFDAEPGGLQPVTSLVPDREVVVAA